MPSPTSVPPTRCESYNHLTVCNDTGDTTAERGASLHPGTRVLCLTTSTTVAYRFSDHSLENPRRFAERIAALQSNRERRPGPSRDLGPIEALLSPPSRHHWHWRCPCALPPTRTWFACPSCGRAPLGELPCDVPHSVEARQPAPAPPASPLPCSCPSTPAWTDGDRDGSTGVVTTTTTITTTPTPARKKLPARVPPQPAPLSAGVAAELICDLQRQLSELQACVEGIQEGVPLADKTSTFHTAASSPPPPPQCDMAVDWASTELSGPAASPSPSATTMALELRNTSPAEPPEMAAATTVGPPPLSSSPYCFLSARNSVALDGTTVQQSQECVQRAANGEEVVPIDASAPMPSSTPSPTAEAHHISLSGSSGGGGCRRHISDVAAVAAGASSRRVSNRRLNALSHRKSWMEAVEAASRHTFVEGDDGRPVTALKRRMVMVASPVSSPLKTRPSSAAVGAAPPLQTGKHQEDEREAVGRAKDAVDDTTAARTSVNSEGAYGTLDAYMWHLTSPETHNAMANVSPEVCQPTISGAAGDQPGADNEASLLMASAASALRSSLATTATVYVIPGEDCGLTLTSPLEAAAEISDTAAQQQQQQQQHQRVCTSGNEAAAGVYEEPHNGVRTPATTTAGGVETGVMEAVRESGVEDPLLHAKTAEALLLFDPSLSTESGAGLPTRAEETRREFFPPLVAIGQSGNAEDDAAEVLWRCTAERQGTTGAPQPPSQAKKGLLAQMMSRLAPTCSGCEGNTQGNDAGASGTMRPTTSYARTRPQAPLYTTAVATTTAEASTRMPSAVTPAEEKAEDTTSSKISLTPTAVGRRRQRRISSEVVELPEVRTADGAPDIPVTSGAQEASQLTEPSFATPSAEPSPLLLQQVAAYQVLMEWTPPPTTSKKKEVSRTNAGTAALASTGHGGEVCLAGEDKSESSITVVREVKPLWMIPPTVTAVADGTELAMTQRGSNSGHTRHSVTVSAGDLSVPSALSETKFVSGVLAVDEARSGSGVERGSAARLVAPLPPPPKVLPPALHSDLYEVLKPPQQPSTSGGHNGSRRRSSEISWYTTGSIGSPSRLMPRPQTPSPAATPYHSLCASSAWPASPPPPPPSASLATASKARRLSALLSSHSMYSEGVKNTEEREAAATPLPPVAEPKQSAANEIQGTLSRIPRKQALPVMKREVGATSPSLGMPSAPRHPPQPAAAASSSVVVLPSVAAALSNTAGMVSQRHQKHHHDGSVMASPINPPCSSNRVSPSTRITGTSLLTTGQYRVWEGNDSVGRLSPPLRIASAAPPGDGSRQQGPLLFASWASALCTPTRLSSSTHFSSRSPVDGRPSSP